jgi:hypothetical protein
MLFDRQHWSYFNKISPFQAKVFREAKNFCLDIGAKYNRRKAFHFSFAFISHLSQNVFGLRINFLKPNPFNLCSKLSLK